MLALQGDPTTGGFGYLRYHDMGHEAWNFLSSQGKVYGYIPRETTVKHPLGGSKRDAKLEGDNCGLARSPNQHWPNCDCWMVRRRNSL